VHTFADRVLVRAGKRSEHKITSIGVTRVHWELSASFGDLPNFAKVPQIQMRLDPLREHVQSERNEVDVSSTFPIPEQGALDPLGARQQPQLGCRDTSSAIVMRVKADDEAVTRRDIPAKPFDPIRV
jgi:hypothetical protein